MDEKNKFFPNIPLFDLTDLIGKTVKIDAIKNEDTTLIFAFDLKTNVTYVLKELISRNEK